MGLVADIHGNTVALDAALDALRGVDLIVCLGDIAAGGPDPVGAVDRIAELGCLTVQGNTDRDVVSPPGWWSDPIAFGAPETAVPIVEASLWSASQLGPDHMAFLGSLPLTVEIDIGSAGRLLGFHGSPASPTDIVSTSATEAELDEMFAGCEHEILAGGHTHVPLLRRHRGQTIVNPGSVGAPFLRYGFSGEVPVLGHASFAVIEIEGPAFSIEFAHAPVEAGQVESMARGSEMPHTEAWLKLRG